MRCHFLKQLRGVYMHHGWQMAEAVVDLSLQSAFLSNRCLKRKSFREIRPLCQWLLAWVVLQVLYGYQSVC